MRSTDLFTAMTLGLLFAGCDREPKVDMKDASVEDVARKVEKARGSEMVVLPGKWVQDVTMETFEIPGMPASAQASVRASRLTHARIQRVSRVSMTGARSAIACGPLKQRRREARPARGFHQVVTVSC